VKKNTSKIALQCNPSRLFRRFFYGAGDMRKFIEAVKHEIYLIRQKLRLYGWAELFGLWK
jgi:hypothetical protein